MTPTGTLLRWGRRKDQRKDVSKEFPIYLDTTDENNSWLLQHSLHRCGDLSICTALHGAGDKVSGFCTVPRLASVGGVVFLFVFVFVLLA